MTIIKINKYCLNNEGHLDENHMALYVDALILDKVEKLPTPVLEHVEDCMECKMEIIELFEIMKSSKNIEGQKHPYFDRTTWGKPRQLMKLAAIFIGFMVVGASIYHLLDNQQDYRQLYADNFVPYQDVVSVSARGDTISEHNAPFDQIMIYYYNNGDYDSSNFFFGKLYGMDKPNDSLLFYYGVSSLAAGDNARAIQLLKEMSSIDNSNFHNQSRWYLALSYLNASANSKGKEQGEMLLNSKNVLQGIIDNNSDYAEKAKVLLSKYQ